MNHEYWSRRLEKRDCTPLERCQLDHQVIDGADLAGGYIRISRMRLIIPQL